MTYETLIKNKKIILKTESLISKTEIKDLANYVLYSLTESEKNEIENDFQNNNESCDFIDLICIGGSITEPTNSDIKHFIPIINIITEKDLYNNKKLKSIFEYKCYQTNDLKNPCNNVIVHEDCLSSFLCACEKLQTKHFVILKELITNNENNERIMQSGDTTTHSEDTT